jgi:uncharacterized surface anchored protein
MKTKILICVLLIACAAPFALAQDDETASVSGRVTTLWGEPVEQAEVSFFRIEGINRNSPTEKLIKLVRTDNEGNYKVGNLPWGQYRVNVEFKGYGHTEVGRFYLWRNAERVLDVGVPMGMLHGIEPSTISGVVRQMGNSSVKDATVTLMNAYDMTKFQQVRTDENGRYSLREIQVGDYVLYAVKPGFSVSATTLRLNNGEKHAVDIKLLPAPHKRPS